MVLTAPKFIESQAIKVSSEVEIALKLQDGIFTDRVVGS
jgi:hypothetical protein